VHDLADQLAPTKKRLLHIAAAGILVHLFLLTTVVFLGHWSLSGIANLRDGPSYLHLAGALMGHADALSEFDRRAFIGYPGLIAAISLLGLSLPTAALLINCLSSALAASLSALVYEDARVGWVIVFFPPSFLTYSTLAMTEASLLALTLGGLLVARRGRWLGGGVLLGYAGLVRPVACFAVLGLMVERWRQGKRRDSLLVGGVAAIVVLLGYVFLQLWTGDALRGVRTYASDQRAFNGRLFGWPFESLIMTPLRYSVPLWKVAYVWPYVLWTLGGCVMALRAPASSDRRDSKSLALLSAIWLAGNTIFVLCVGHIWGFHDFNRHILAALPPLIWIYRRYIPTRLGIAAPLSACSLILGVVGLLRSR
jgi:hypothetical protein